MKERDVIKQLHLLQSVQPEHTMLRTIRKHVKSPYTGENKLHFKNSLPLIPVISTLVFASILFITVTIILFPEYIENAVTTARIALAADNYDKAKIALANFQDQLSFIQQNSSDTNKRIVLSQSLALANTEMSGLQLIGEKGKYTSYQCLELYESYHKDLNKIEGEVDLNKNNSESMLVSQAEQYDKQAESKLKKYDHGNRIDSRVKK